MSTGALLQGVSPLDATATARSVTPWIRAQLALMHREPSERVPLSANGWSLNDEPVQEWMLAPEHELCERIESEVRDWALGRGLYRADAQSALLEGPCTMLACAVLPDAPIGLVRLISQYWTLIIAFDDQVVERGLPPAPYVNEVRDILLYGRLPSEPDAFHRAFADIGAGIRAVHGDAILADFTESVVDAIETYVREWERRLENNLPTIEEYLRDGVVNSHIIPGMLVQRLQRGLVAPDERLSNDLGHLARLVTHIARLENDLLSLAKDERDGAVNICWIVAAEYGITPVQAVLPVLGMIKSIRAEHDELLAAITTDTAPGEVRRQAATLSDWVDACYAWFLTVARYGVSRSAA